MTKELPEGWKLTELGKVCHVIMGQSPPSDTYNNDGAGLPFFQGKAEFTELHPIVKKWCSDPNKIAEPNDILLSVRAPVGTTNIANQMCCIGRGLAAIRYPNYKYIFYFLRLNEKELDKKGTGTTFRAISGETVRTLLTPIPPPDQEAKIVEKIEELFSELDKGIENLKTAQQQLKVYRQAVLKWAFEGKLTNENVKDGELPEGWELKELGSIADKVFDGPFGSNLKSDDYVDDGVRVIRLENIGVLDFMDEYKTYVTQDKYATINRHTVTGGDIIFSSFIIEKVRVVVLPTFIKCAINKADCFCIRVNDNEVDNHFLAYFLSTKNVYNQLVNQVHGATRPRINTKQLKVCLIPIGSLKQQKEVVQEIESRLSVCDKMEETIGTSLQQAEALRQSILKRAFEGKLVKN